MKKIISFFMCAAVLFIFCINIAGASGNMEKYSGDELNYWLYIPDNESDNMPLIVYLHGGSGKGDDLDMIVGTEGFPKYVKDGIITDINAYILFPQCPTEEKGWNTLADPLETLINEISENYSIDTDRISLTGHSMCGTGVWSISLAKPYLFSRIAPMSGSVETTENTVEILSDIPVRAFVGENDTIVDPASSEEMISELQKRGADAEIVIFENASHFNVPSLAYLNENIDIVGWLTQKTAPDENKSIIFTIDSTQVNLFGSIVENDVAPLLRNSRTMLPARFLAEKLGASVDWDESQSKVTITKNDIVIEIFIGSDTAYINGEEKQLDSPAFIENERTYTPLRFISEALGADVLWNADENTVTVTIK